MGYENQALWGKKTEKLWGLSWRIQEKADDIEMFWSTQVRLTQGLEFTGGGFDFLLYWKPVYYRQQSLL